MPHATPVSSQLHHRAARDGGAVLLTHYGPGGARTELSVASFANWVDKTANLLGELDLEPDADVALPVLGEAPAHWMAWVWPFACWRAGLSVRVASRADAAGADLAVIGPREPAPVGDVTYACSLDPWGRPLGDLPAGVADFAGEALAQPDFFPGVPTDPDAPAWFDHAGVRTHADVAALASVTERVCAAAPDAATALTLLAGAVLGGGSVVLVDDPEVDAGRVAASEHARLLP
ncbi:TIGR03089 family protein [Propioniciclava soli]|uniref:TIGR03089 family protein n=1 Tax=Propioniciclava soli TaxID=2775081 RepID=UPI001E3E3A02